MAGGFPRAVDIEHGPGVARSIHQSSGLLVGGKRTREQIIEKKRAQGFDWLLGKLCQKRESVERAGSRSRSNKAMKGAAKGWSRS